MIDEYTGKKIVSPLDISDTETMCIFDIPITDFGKVEKNRVVIGGTFVPVTSENKELWDSVIFEIENLLVSSGLKIIQAYEPIHTVRGEKGD